MSPEPSPYFAPPATDAASRQARNDRVARFIAHSPHFANVGDLAHWLDLLPEEASEALHDLASEPRPPS